MVLQAQGRHHYAKHWLKNYQYILTPGFVIMCFSMDCTPLSLLCKNSQCDSGLCLFPNRYPQSQLVEVNAHSLFSKWFSESGKLVCNTVIVICCYCSMLAILHIDFILVFQFSAQNLCIFCIFTCNEFVHDIDWKMNLYRLMASACSLSLWCIIGNAYKTFLILGCKIIPKNSRNGWGRKQPGICFDWWDSLL